MEPQGTPHMFKHKDGLYVFHRRDTTADARNDSRHPTAADNRHTSRIKASVAKIIKTPNKIKKALTTPLMLALLTAVIMTMHGQADMGKEVDLHRY